MRKSHSNRRLRVVEPSFWQALFALLAEVFKYNNADRSYVVDSLAVVVCDNK